MSHQILSTGNQPPLLSIVIPTRNRQTYVESAVASILAIDDPQIEVVIQDNSDEKILSESLSGYFNDCRLKYRYTPPPLSSVGNFNNAIKHATGEYVCIIGDDDGINPQIIDAVRWAKENNIDALTGNLSANYRWANTGAPNTFFTKMTDSTLTMTHFSGRFRQVNIEKSLREFCNSGFTYHIEYDLPRVYHGIVKRILLNELHYKNGAYIKALSPDIYLSLAIANYVKKLVVIDYPLTIPGVCQKSSSVNEGQINNHPRGLNAIPHLQNNPGYVWTKEVPPLYTIETIWADSAFHAFQDMNREDLLKRFNSYQLYARILRRNPDTWRACIDHIKHIPNTNNIIKLIRLSIAYLSVSLSRFFSRALRRVMIIAKLRRLDEIKSLPNMSAATDALVTYLKLISKNSNRLPF